MRANLDDVNLSYDKDSNAIQAMNVVDTVAVASVTTAPDNQNALPAGTRLVQISTINPIWIQFGGSGVTVTAASNGAILVPGGGLVLRLTEDETHFAVVAATTEATPVCCAKLV